MQPLKRWGALWAALVQTRDPRLASILWEETKGDGPFEITQYLGLGYRLAVSPRYHHTLDRWWETVYIENPDPSLRPQTPPPLEEARALLWVAQEGGLYLGYGHDPEPRYSIASLVDGTFQSQAGCRPGRFGPSPAPVGSLQAACLQAQARGGSISSHLQGYRPVIIPQELGAEVLGKDVAFQIRDAKHLHEVVKFYNHHGDSIPERAFILRGLGEDLTLRTAGEAGAYLHALALGVPATTNPTVWCP